MPSPHELSGTQDPNPYAEALLRRNTELCEAESKRAKESFSETYRLRAEVYPGLINIDAIPAAAETHGRMAANAVIENRETGQNNDPENHQPGIYVTGILDQRLFGALRSRLEIDGIDHHLIKGELSEAYSELDQHYSLHLPGGAYRLLDHFDNQATQYDLAIYGTCVELESSVSPDSFHYLGSLNGGYIDHGNQNVTGVIGRVVGADGSLWQNPKAQPDGSRRESK